MRNQTLIFTLGGFLPAAFNLLFLPAYSFFLTPEDFGLFGYVISFQSILIVITVLSLNSFMLRDFFVKDNDYKNQELFGTIFLFLFLFNIIFIGCLILVAPYFVDLLSDAIPYRPYFLLMILSLFFEFLFIFPLIIFRVQKLAKYYVLFVTSKQIVTFVIAIIAINNYEAGILGRFIGILAANIIFSFLSLYIIYKNSILIFKPRIIRKGLLFSIPILPAALIVSIQVSIDKLLLINYIPLEQLGLYTLAASLASIINFLSLGYYRANEPVIFEAFNKENFANKIENIIKFFLILVIWASLLLVLFAKDILDVFFNNEFYYAYVYIPWFVFALVLNGQRTMLGSVLYAFNITKYDLPLVIISLTIYLISFFSLTPYFGIYGALISLIISSLAYLISTMFLVRSHVKIKHYLFFSIPCLIMIIILSFIFELTFLTNIQTIMFKILLAFFVTYRLFIYLKNNPEIIPS